MTKGDVIVAAGVTKTYTGGADEVVALDNIDLAIARGELLAIVGASGSGKTTLLNCFSGLDGIDSGTVLVDGDDIHALDDAERARRRARAMGFVFQAFNLLPVLSAVENVELPLLLSGTRARVARARALEMLERVRLSARADHRPAMLSGGEQQRVAIARSLVNEPAIVWADEPTGALDSENAHVVVELLLDLHRDGHTVALVTHDEDVAAVATRTIRMRDGRIVSR